MENKFSMSIYRGYLNCKRKIDNLGKEESGMETIETVILIVVAVIIVGLIVNFLTKSGFQTSTGEDCGLVGYLFDKIKTTLNTAFQQE